MGDYYYRLLDNQVVVRVYKRYLTEVDTILKDQILFKISAYSRQGMQIYFNHGGADITIDTKITSPENLLLKIAEIPKENQRRIMSG